MAGIKQKLKKINLEYKNSKTKLNFMLADEKADFVGFFTTKLLWAKNDWFVLDYIMHANELISCELIKNDFLYLLNAALYQKLNELE